jgi:hypothetical protein
MDRESLFDARQLGQAASEVATMAALALIREHGDAEAAISTLSHMSIPVEGDEILDAAGVAAQAIRTALEMGVVPR